MNARPKPTLSPRMRRAMGAKAAGYGLLSAIFYPGLGMAADQSVKPMLAAFGFVCALVASLALFIYRRALSEEERTPLMASRLGAAAVAIAFLAVGQLIIIGLAIYQQLS